MKWKRTLHEKSVTFEDCLNDLLREIAELSDMRTGPGSDVVIMAKTISAVRDIETFAPVCRNPPADLQALNSSLRSCALEADRAIIRGNTDLNTSFSYAAMDKFLKSYYVDRHLKSEGPDTRRKRNGFKGYGKPINGKGYNSLRHRKTPHDVCIICFKKGCHSSKHRTAGKFARAFAAAIEDSDQEKDSEESESEDEEDEFIDESASVYIAAARSMHAMGIPPRHAQTVIDSAVIDTASNILSTVGVELSSFLCVASVRRTKIMTTDGAREIQGVGSSIKTLGTIMFHFYFGGREYCVKVYVVPGSSPFLLSHRDLDIMGLNYQSLYKVIERPEDGHQERVEMRGNLPHLLFSTYGYFTEVELRNMHRNLGHPSVDKQVKIISDPGIQDLPKSTRQQLIELVKSCSPCQFNKKKPRRFLFSIKDDITGEFNHILQIDAVKLSDGNVLHVVCKGTGFQSGKFLSNMSAKMAWTVLRRC